MQQTELDGRQIYGTPAVERDTIAHRIKAQAAYRDIRIGIIIDRDLTATQNGLDPYDQLRRLKGFKIRYSAPNLSRCTGVRNAGIIGWEYGLRS